MYRLTFQSRDATRAPFTGDAAPVTIGRAAGCTLQLTAAGLHDHHATLDRRADGYYLRDLVGSRTVRVNDQAINDHRLSSGDEIEIGAVRMHFHIIHDTPGSRRAFDIWQAVAGAAVLLLVLGQIGFLGWIFAQPHPRNMKLDIVKGKQAKALNAAPVVPPPTEPVPLAPLVPLTPAPAVAAPPPVLNRQLKITRVDRVEGRADVTWRIQIKAQVRDRQLDSSAVQIIVHCYSAGNQLIATQEAPRPAAWENFSSKQIPVRVNLAPARCAGCVVRTYYRQQLQDIWASAPALATPAP
ncbi:MAG: hypothetical protein PCFJNLEI_00080 [Verrucomicrobiae bacterium]|nr:hypothetical protein [Verrucomicrobiae bacterium]